MLLSTTAAFLFPMTVTSQEIVDLPGQDQQLTIVEEEIFSIGSLEGELWENFSRVAGVAFDADGNLLTI